MTDLAMSIRCTHCNTPFESRMLAFGEKQDFEEANFIDLEELCPACNRLSPVTKQNSKLCVSSESIEAD